MLMEYVCKYLGLGGRRGGHIGSLKNILKESNKV